MCHNSAVVEMSVYQFSDPGSFPAREGYDLLFRVDMVKFSSSWVDGGGLGRKSQLAECSQLNPRA